MNRLLLLLLAVCCVPGFTSPVAAQPECQSIEYVEELNQGVLAGRITHITGKSAKVFIALDPIWSLPEFDDVPYRHPDDMIMIKGQFRQLMQQDIDEVVAWKFNRPGLGAAVAFSDGCAVPGYGEPDMADKLERMNDAYERIMADGLDDESVRDSIEQLLYTGRSYGRHGNVDAKIDAIIEKIRPLLQ